MGILEMDFERILGVPFFIVVLTPSCCEESKQNPASIETRILTAKSEEKKPVDRWIFHKSERSSAHIKTNIPTWKEEKTDENASELKSRKIDDWKISQKCIQNSAHSRPFSLHPDRNLRNHTLEKFQVVKTRIFQDGNIEKFQFPT